MQIEVSDETVDQIIVEGLVNSMDQLKEAIDGRLSGEGIPYYDNDVTKDIEYIQEDIDAIRKVLDFYGVTAPPHNAKT